MRALVIGGRCPDQESTFHFCDNSLVVVAGVAVIVQPMQRNSLNRPPIFNKTPGSRT